ncbi:hypothetical protein J6590_075046 [Homalodisca vitripennis]|nr:hypothetical protein J6590_075046 [Homalodisca vitripennis]
MANGVYRSPSIHLTVKSIVKGPAYLLTPYKLCPNHEWMQAGETTQNKSNKTPVDVSALNSIFVLSPVSVKDSCQPRHKGVPPLASLSAEAGTDLASPYSKKT